MIKFDVKNRFTGAVQFTAEIDCGDDASPGIKLGLAVTWAKKEDANLRGADLRGADLRGVDLRDANLRGAHGINDYVKCIQLDTYPITYTATHIQIGCERHTHEEWRGFSDAQIRAMDGRAAVDWWGSWKDWLFDLIERCPAKPTGAECANEAAE
jgi:hypothetical protein